MADCTNSQFRSRHTICCLLQPRSTLVGTVGHSKKNRHASTMQAIRHRSVTGLLFTDLLCCKHGYVYTETIQISLLVSEHACILMLLLPVLTTNRKALCSQLHNNHIIQQRQTSLAQHCQAATRFFNASARDCATLLSGAYASASLYAL